MFACPALADILRVVVVGARCPRLKVLLALTIGALLLAFPLWVRAEKTLPKDCPTPAASMGQSGNGQGYDGSGTTTCQTGASPAPQTQPTPGSSPDPGKDPGSTNSQSATNAPPPNPAPCGRNASIAIQWNAAAVKPGPAGTPLGCPAPPPPPLTPATSPLPDLSPYYAQVFEEIRTSPGNISAAPPNHTGLVNLPTCFWLTGQAVPDQKQVTMDLKGAPDAAGQQITYHITLTVTLESTSWTFGDASTTETPAPTQCVGISGDPSSLVAHDYLNYSTSSFMVTASETYTGSVTMTWTDSNGPQAPPAMGGPTQTITTAPYPIKVDQEEGLGTG